MLLASAPGDGDGFLCCSSLISGRRGCCFVRRPRTVAAPLSISRVVGTPRTRTAVSRSSAASIWSQSSSSSSSSPSAAVPFPLRLARSEPLLYECNICGACACGVREWSRAGGEGLFFCAKRKIDAIDGRRGDLSVSAGAVPKGELVRMDGVESGPVLLFAGPCCWWVDWSS